MIKRVCIASTISFWLKLKGGFISCSNTDRHPRSMPQAAEASLRLHCHQRQIFFFSPHSQLHAPTACWPWAEGKLQLPIENKLCRSKVSYQQVALSSLWLHYMGRAGTGAGAGARDQRVWESLPTVLGPLESLLQSLLSMNLDYFRLSKQQKIDKLYVYKKIPSFL